MPDSKETFEAGMKVRREMFGAAGADDQIANATDFTRDMQDMVTRYCFGETWNRPPFDRRMRSILTIAMLVGLNRPNQLRVHIRGAIANGVHEDEIREILMHAMIYVGVPASVDSFMHAAEALKEVGRG
ncbi:carboxymuconolactone decarboxylase family protein [Chitinasiproducens palmae]|uniref:4-carboxymuconolactone decarboxylase n=1 Tax=Chitinasiproducens palmae TaxID=1770053 RepID=A0A1H2PTV3_9BURK|nr:carboxymuconolactone decarboxylase family protein [Chitinasiproducens palmae]SDV50573.1 4-carboxymuconolactone decarboxylase [Chitinasiproducens palmae]